MIKVMRTSGKDSEFVSKSELNPIHLFIVSSENCHMDHGYGDMLTNAASDITFAILAKEYVGSKVNNDAVRTGLILLFKHLKKEFQIPPLSIVINRHQFRNEHEIEIFECIFTGIASLMFTDEELEGLSLIITNYDSEEPVEHKEKE